MNDSDLLMVMSIRPEEYKLSDLRSQKPFHGKNQEGGGVFQSIDEVVFKNSKSSKEEIEFLTPNPVGLLLHVYQESKRRTEEIFEEFCQKITEEEFNKGTDKFISFTKKIYDYINEFQKTILFGYSALETFINISIPEDYSYSVYDNKGITNVYDKRAIERWISTSIKLSDVLVDIYKTPSIKNKKIWTYFKNFEEFRNEIIHLKTDDKKYYHKYFKRNNLIPLSIPVDIMNFFFEKRENKEITNPMWPWVVDAKNDFPVMKEFDSNILKVVGNVHSGKME